MKKGDPRLSSRKDKQCLQPGCGSPQYCKGSCREHYRAIRKEGLDHALSKSYNSQVKPVIMETVDSAWCSTCNEFKPIDQFRYKNGSSPRKRTQCSDCTSNRNYIRRYGITLGQYEKLAKAQGYKCRLCLRGQHEFEYMLAVDHNHETGAVRGLLCRPCNTALERAETPGWLERAETYLK